MLEAEISRLTGLILVEFVEIAVIIATSIAAGGFLMTWKTRRKEAKIASAHLILELLKPWRNPDFQQLLHEMVDPNTTEYDEIKLEQFLNQLESVAIFWKDKTLTDTHVKEFFGENLKLVRDDKFIQDWMNEYIVKNPEYYFVNLTELVKKVKEWKL